jgi:hypothetical protein
MIRATFHPSEALRDSSNGPCLLKVRCQHRPAFLPPKPLSHFRLWKPVRPKGMLVSMLMIFTDSSASGKKAKETL